MTLQELFKQVKGKKQKSKPKLKTLINGKHKIIAEGRHDNGIVKVYDNGYIFYSEDISNHNRHNIHKYSVCDGSGAGIIDELALQKRRIPVFQK